MQKRILITGANGFVGSYVGRELQRLGYSVLAVVRSESAATGLHVDGIETTVVKQTLSAASWTNAVQGVEAIIHLAGRAHIMQDEHPNPLEAFREVNVGMTQALAEAAAVAGVARFIYASSIKVHDADARATALEPQETLNPQDPYGRSKWEAEKFFRDLLQYAPNTMRASSAPLLFGPGAKGNLQRLMKMVEREVPMPFGAIHNQRSLLSLPNLTSFFDTCLQHQDPTGVWMVEEASPFSTTQMITMMAQGMGKRSRLIPVPVFLLKTLGALTESKLKYSASPARSP